jgi:ATP-dependent RNA helicase DDX27
MAPKTKKRSIDDDFIYTVSDREDFSAEEEGFEPEPPKKKAKPSKKSKSRANGDSSSRAEEEETDLDSEFEFMAEEEGKLEEFESWGFEGAKKSIGDVGKRGVDLDDIIRRQEERKARSGKATSSDIISKDQEDDGEDAQIDLDDAEDEVLADDAFGMQPPSDEEGTDDAEGDEGSEEEQPHDSDEDPAAQKVQDEEEGSDGEEQREAEEEAKRKKFFASEPTKKGKKGKGTNASFQDMSLSRPVLRGLDAAGYVKPTPIQAKTIPIALMGKDLVGGAVTGSGKTAAFILPILERLLFRSRKEPASRVVVLTPTRELAIQCHSVATKLASFVPDIKFTLAVGGLSLSAQEAELKRRPDVIIATPGRFIDHMRNSASFAIDAVEILVLDEADRMLEDGFADELNEILTTLPKTRQTMLFSATMTSSVDRLVRVGLQKPVRLMVDAQGDTVSTLTQEFVRLRPGREDRRMGYLVWLCKNLYTSKAIIFFRQKKAAHHSRVVFGKLGMSCAELHGSLNQAQVSLTGSLRVGSMGVALTTNHSELRASRHSGMARSPSSWPQTLHRVVSTSKASTRSSTTKPLKRSTSTSTA